jgi:hypothetical protein
LELATRVKSATLVFLRKNLTGQAPVKSSTKIGGQVRFALYLRYI